MAISTARVAERPREYVAVRGPDAEDYLQRMVSNDVAGLSVGEACDALLLTAKARIIAPLRALRRSDDDFLLLTEPGLGERVRRELLRSRFAAKAAVELEHHRSTIVFGDGDGIPTSDYGEPAVEVLDRDVGGEPVQHEELERLRIRARTPVWGRELDERVLPAEAGLTSTHVSFTKGCYPGQEPIARLHHRGHANRALRVLEIESDELPQYDAEIRHREKVIGRVTSAVAEDNHVLALGYVRVDVPDDAELSVESRPARLHSAAPRARSSGDRAQPCGG